MRRGLVHSLVTLLQDRLELASGRLPDEHEAIDRARCDVLAVWTETRAREVYAAAIAVVSAQV
jgi:hypothetical protein